MLKVKLKYTNYQNDKRYVNMLIASYHDINILKTRTTITDCVITFLVKDYYRLNELMIMLNRYTAYGVEVKKVKDLDKSILHRVFKHYSNDDNNDVM